MMYIKKNHELIQRLTAAGKCEKELAMAVTWVPNLLTEVIIIHKEIHMQRISVSSFTDCLFQLTENQAARMDLILKIQAQHLAPTTCINNTSINTLKKLCYS